VAAKELHENACNKLGSEAFVNKYEEWLISKLVETMTNGEIDMTHNRGAVYTENELRFVLQSFYRLPKIPRDNIVLFKEGGRYVCLDGFQRLTAIALHVDGALAVNIDEANFSHLESVEEDSEGDDAPPPPGRCQRRRI
jgi:hypothetical protein